MSPHPWIQSKGYQKKGMLSSHHEKNQQQQQQQKPKKEKIISDYTNRNCSSVGSYWCQGMIPLVKENIK